MLIGQLCPPSYLGSAPATGVWDRGPETLDIIPPWGFPNNIMHAYSRLGNTAELRRMPSPTGSFTASSRFRRSR
jgi:hypothetical protein